MQDALSVLQVLVGRLGRQPTLIELLQELGHAPAGMPVQGVNDPGYAAQPQPGSPLLGDVPSDQSLSMGLQMDDISQAVPDLMLMRQQMVERLLFGDLLGGGGHGPMQATRASPAHGGHTRPVGRGPIL